MSNKSYYTRTVEKAVGMARAEPGGETMPVNSRQAPPEARDMGEYEVVFSIAPATAAAARAGSELALAGAAEPAVELELGAQAGQALSAA